MEAATGATGAVSGAACIVCACTGVGIDRTAVGFDGNQTEGRIDRPADIQVMNARCFQACCIVQTSDGHGIEPALQCREREKLKGHGKQQEFATESPCLTGAEKQRYVSES